MSLGQAVVDITANTAPINRSISGLSGSLRTAILGSAIGNIIADGVSFITSKVVNLASTLKDAVFSAGLDRLLNIEDAQAKLIGLGHSAETVEQVMTNALNAVKGTAFGLDEAATIAASSIAAGVQPGRDLERTLKLVADTATIAGGSMTELGGIFNKVAASNRLTMQEVNQLSDRGVPILKFLAEQMGVTQEAAREMVSAGEIDFATFRDAIEENIAGAALASGNTTRGAFANMQASLARVGANLIGGVFPLFREVFQGVIGFMEPIEGMATRAGEAITTYILGLDFSGILATLRGGASAVGDFFMSLKDGAVAIWDIMYPALRSIGQTLTQDFIPSIQDAASAITSRLGPILSTVGDFLRNSFLPALSAWWSFLAEKIWPILITVSAAIRDELLWAFDKVWSVISNFVLPVLTVLYNFFTNNVLPVLSAVATFISDEVVPRWLSFRDTMRDVADAIQERFLTPLQTAVSWFRESLLPIIVEAAGVLREQLGVAIEAVSNLWTTHLQPTVQTMIDVWNNQLKPALLNIWEIIDGPVITALKALGIIIGGAVFVAIMGFISVLVGLVTGIAGVINILTSVISWIGNFVTKIREAWATVSSVNTGLLGSFNAFRNGVINAISGLMSVVTSIPGRIKSALSGIGSLLFGTGENLIRGLINGIRNMAGNVAQAARDVVQGAIDAAKNALGISSPSKVFMRIGVDTLSGLANGLAQTQIVDMAMDKVIKRVTFRGVDLATGAKELLAHLNRDGNVFEDLSFRGMSNQLKAVNDLLADQFYKSGQDFNRNSLATFLEKVARENKTSPGSAVTTFHVGGITVNVSGVSGEEAGKKAAEVIIQNLGQAMQVR